MKELILGGARSGKSALAMQRAQQCGKSVVYVATALGHEHDAEMQARIEQHRAERPTHWRTVECHTHLAECLTQADARDVCIVVDCLTLWLTNVLWTAEYTVQMHAWRRERLALLACLPTLQADLILVSNEVGLGIVPDNAAARTFRDEQGWLNQALAQACDHVTLVTAGLPLTLKSAT